MNIEVNATNILLNFCSYELPWSLLLTEAEVAALRSIPDEASRLEHLQEAIEPGYFDDHPGLKTECDKSWDAMHRALADGKLTWDGGSYPLSHVVLGGELRYTDSDYIMSLKSPAQVQDIASALPERSEPEFRKRYFAIDAKNYEFPLSEEDFHYTWEWFQAVRQLYTRAATSNRYVLFTADQ